MKNNKRAVVMGRWGNSERTFFVLFSVLHRTSRTLGEGEYSKHATLWSRKHSRIDQNTGMPYPSYDASVLARHVFLEINITVCAGILMDVRCAACTSIIALAKWTALTGKYWIFWRFFAEYSLSFKDSSPQPSLQPSIGLKETRVHQFSLPSPQIL